MNSLFRALAIGAIAMVVALACPSAWAQVTDPAPDSAAAPASDPVMPSDQRLGPAANEPVGRLGDQLFGPLADLRVGPLAEAPANLPAGPPVNPPADQPADQSADQPANERADLPNGQSSNPSFKRLWGDIESYSTAPLRWDSEQWALFGGALGSVALAHHFDSNVRTHFAPGPATGGSTSDLQDAAPAAALFVATYIYSSQWQDRSGLTVTWAMAEAAGLSTVTTYALKYAVRRQGPNETTDPNQWFASGSSFPSEHAAAAFAIGTVFAESGTGGYRWVTRLLGYGVASFTAYERLKHNAHWLSDVVAGAALGGSTGIFVLDRTYGGRPFSSAFSVVPMDGGLMLAYHKALP
ncbi:MAG TPA: phosphatase PAP2 family protein [Steroidobacteraceae bacterium]